jgi:hypothetical protein
VVSVPEIRWLVVLVALRVVLVLKMQQPRQVLVGKVTPVVEVLLGVHLPEVGVAEPAVPVMTVLLLGVLAALVVTVVTVSPLLSRVRL